VRSEKTSSPVALKKGVAGFHSDDAERTLEALLEKQRLEEEAKLRAFVEAVAEGILLVSAEGKIHIANRCIEEMFGYSREELVGQGMDILVPERYRAAHAGQRSRYFAEPGVRAMGAGRDLTGCRKDGREFPVEIGLSYVQTERGMLALGLVTDITERKRIESEMTRINAELVRSNTELGQFAYVASHDLQEPLRMISGYLQLLERRYQDKLDPEALEFIRYAVEGAVRMKRLIEDLLALSRAGTQAANFRPVESRTLFETACANLAVSIRESGAEITCGSLPLIVADPVLLTQVFQNLIGNAIKFRSPGYRPRIRVSAANSPEGRVFAVRDDGIGIEARHMERIFGIFERLHSADQYEGSGVGLSITRRILERHGGRIWVESKAGEGSTFSFLIPGQIDRVDASRAASGNS
jgi:PAS domain S-box-containing protein